MPAAKPPPSKADAAIKKSRELLTALTKFRNKKNNPNTPDAPAPIPKETKPVALPPAIAGSQKLQTTLAQIRKFVTSFNAEAYSAFVATMNVLPRAIVADNVEDLEEELEVRLMLLHEISGDGTYDQFLRRLRLPYNPEETKLFPRGAETLLELLAPVWSRNKEAEARIALLKIEIDESNLIDQTNSLVKRLKGEGDLLLKLDQVSETILGSLEREDLRLPAFADFASVVEFYMQGRETWENVGQTLELWGQLLAYQRDLAAGKPPFPGLSFEGLFDWVLLVPLRRKGSVAAALSEEFDIEPRLASDLLREMSNRCLRQIDQIISGYFNLFGTLLQRTVDLFEREFNPELDAMSELGQACWKNAGVLLLIFRTWNQGTFFPGALESNPVTMAKLAWKKFLNDGPPEQSIERLNIFFSDAVFPQITKEMAVEPKLITAPLERRKRQLVATSTCVGCAFASEDCCPECAAVLCGEYCYSSHTCETEPGALGLTIEQLKQKCRIDLPLYAARKVLDDQEVNVGEKTGQMLAFEYPVLQATQMSLDNANLFHLATIECRPSCARLYVRYIRATVNMLTQLAPGEEIHILINGQTYRQQGTGYGRVTEDSPQLRARSIVIPEGAVITTNRETDAAWLHGEVASIPLNSGTNTIRLLLPPSLQPVGRFTKEVTGALELVLTD